MLRQICGYRLLSGKTFDERQSFCGVLKCQGHVHSADELGMCFGDFDGRICRHIDGVHDVGYWNLDGRILLEFCLEKELCVLITWHKREEVGIQIGRNEKKIDFALIGKEHRQFL